MKLLKIAALVSAASFFSTSASALTWTLEDAVFTSSGTKVTLEADARVVGSFDYDASTNTYSNFDIQVVGVNGTSPSGQTYSGTYNNFSYGTATSFVVTQTTASYMNDLAGIYVGMSMPLTDEAGASVNLRIFNLGYCYDPDCFGIRGAANSSNTGKLTTEAPAVPLPASLPLLAAACGGLWWRRRNSA